MGTNKAKDFNFGEDGILKYKWGNYVPQDLKLKKLILEERYKRRLILHLRMTKMYQDLKKMFWWSTMKRDKAKIEHQKLGELLQMMEILEWKWDRITIDFVVSLPRKTKGYDVIWVIVDRLSKCAHFLLININYSLEKLRQLYIKEVVCLHEMVNLKEQSNLWTICYELVCWIILEA
ncbi:hypothetical protein CR513_44199, partial [Mucuna pruriens]